MRTAGLSGNAEFLSDLLFKLGIHHVLRREEPLFNKFPEAWAFGAFPRRTFFGSQLASWAFCR
jgi:hypothetical protein